MEGINGGRYVACTRDLKIIIRKSLEEDYVFICDLSNFIKKIIKLITTQV